ncbi:MAG: T9SS type A sorting domain-containing protein [Lentimicrobiaceae bacterium]|nr:T9SS type A sorting domain-containing protein [Lentimicrobiaceae bacterium]
MGIAEYNLQDSLLRQIRFPGGADSTTYPGAGRKNILVTSDYIWVMGWYNTLESGFPCQMEQTFIVLNKLNFNLDLQEQLFYGGDGMYWPRDIIETSDHHIVVAGEVLDNLTVPFDCHFDPFVLKVNSEGLIVSTDNPDQPIAQEAIVFPNPGSDYLQVKLAIQHKSAHIQLFDIGGRLVLETDLTSDLQRVETSQLGPGTFIYRITASNRIIGSGKWVKQ